jgi:hypothetical protein
MGKNSVSPSIIAIIACNVFMKMYVIKVGRGSLELLFALVLTTFRTFQDGIIVIPKPIKTVVGAKRIRLKLNIASLKQQDITTTTRH